MKKIKFQEAYDLLEKGELSPLNFYNTDISYEQQIATRYYQKNKHDTIDIPQVLKKVFLDIEVFSDDEEGLTVSEMLRKATYLINAISHYHSSEKTYYSYVIPPPGSNYTEEDYRQFFLQESSRPIVVGKTDSGEEIYDTYRAPDEDIQVQFFKNGKSLVEGLWSKIKQTDPAVLSSFNGDNFDYPYLYRYLLGENGGDHDITAQTMSQFGCVELKDGRDRAGNEIQWVYIIDYPIVDMQYCYKTRDDGGLGLGKKLQSYSLQNISNEELGLKKVEYKAEGLTLDGFYKQDPMNFFLYNLYDTALIVKLDRKMGMIDLYNMQRRKMRTALTSSLRGSSALFDTYIYSKLNEDRKYVRYGLSSESSFSILSSEILNIPKPKSKSKINWNVTDMNARLCGQIINRFAGAYVKEPTPGIYTGLICDFDANRLYPSMINQYNVGIETFFGRIIQPHMDTAFTFFDNVFGKMKLENVPEIFYQRFLEESENFIENIKSDEYDLEEEERDNKFKNKNDAKQYYYYIMTYLLRRIIESGYTLQDLIEPDDIKKYVFAKTYFNSLIEVMEMTHPKEKEYNHIAYKYIINSEEISNNIRIIENFNEPTYRIISLPGEKLLDYLRDHKIGITLSGTLFKIHEEELSLFYKFLDELYSLRNQYKSKMFTFPENSSEYSEFNRRQTTTKVIMNSTYGLLGMGSFRYSNKWLAKTITTCGRLALKTAQFYTDKYLDVKYLSNQ